MLGGAAAAASQPRPVNLRQLQAGGDGVGTPAAAATSGFLAVERGLMSQRSRQADFTSSRQVGEGPRARLLCVSHRLASFAAIFVEGRDHVSPDGLSVQFHFLLHASRSQAMLRKGGERVGAEG